MSKSDKGYIIPDDWDNDEWQCIKLYWPKSSQWEAILRGVLTAMARGRTWDRNTGIIRDAQSVGWEIFRRSWPFVPCNAKCNGGANETDNCSNIMDGVWAGDIVGCCEDKDDCEVIEMSCNSPGIPIKIEGGKLWYWHCCQWELVGAIEGAVADVPEDWAGDPDDTDFYACGKANAIVETIFGVTKSVWDERDNYPWQWSSHIKSDWPGLQLSTNYIAIAVTQAILCTTLGFDETDWNNDGNKQKARQRIAAILGDDALPLTDAQWWSIRSIIAGLFDLTQAPLTNLMVNCCDVIGKNDMSNVAILGATNADANCDQYTESWGDVYWTGEVTLLTTLANAQDGEMDVILAEGNTKMQVDWNGTTSEGSTDNTSIFGIHTPQPLAWLELEFRGIPPTDAWDETCASVDWSNIQFGDTDPEPTSVDWINQGPDNARIRFTWSTGGSVVTWGYDDAHSARYCGRYAPNPFSQGFSVKIAGFEYYA